MSEVKPNKAETLSRAFETAKIIASKSPIAVFGTKKLLDYSRDHSVAEGTLRWLLF